MGERRVFPVGSVMKVVGWRRSLWGGASLRWVRSSGAVPEFSEGSPCGRGGWGSPRRGAVGVGRVWGGGCPRRGAEPPLGGAASHRPLPAPPRLRAGTEASGTLAPAAGPQRGARAAASRRRPAGLVGAGPGGEQAAEPGPRAGARASTPGRGPASSPPCARRSAPGVRSSAGQGRAEAAAGRRPEAEARSGRRPEPGRAPRGSWRGREARCWPGAAASARATAAWTSVT